MWFHVDGAYGGFAAAVPDASNGFARAEPGGFRCRRSAQMAVRATRSGLRAGARSEALRAAFAYHPPYYHFEENATNYVDYGPQNSRGFRALKVWLALKQVGAAGYRKMIADDIRLSQAIGAAAVSRHEEFEFMTQDLSIATFRYVPRGSSDAVLKKNMPWKLISTHSTGKCSIACSAAAKRSFPTPMIDGHYVLRACIVNFHTIRWRMWKPAGNRCAGRTGSGCRTASKERALKSGAGGGSRILTLPDYTQVIDFIKGDKSQKHQIRGSKVHGRYTRTVYECPLNHVSFSRKTGSKSMYTRISSSVPKAATSGRNSRSSSNAVRWLNLTEDSRSYMDALGATVLI